MSRGLAFFESVRKPKSWGLPRCRNYSRSVRVGIGRGMDIKHLAGVSKLLTRLIEVVLKGVGALATPHLLMNNQAC